MSYDEKVQMFWLTTWVVVIFGNALVFMPWGRRRCLNNGNHGGTLSYY